MTKKINLTTRKKSLPEKFLGTFIRETVNDKTVLTVRYSHVYQPKGHLWNPSFKVLRGGYWLRHRILTEQDVATYETLQFLCADDEPFTVEGLAAAKGQSKETLRRIFDNLINAELLEVATVSDGQGKPNYYILRTPLYERATFNEATRKRIRDAKETFPTTFLEDEADRLKLKISKNRLGKLRRLELRRRHAAKEEKDLTGASRTLYDFFSDRYRNKNLALHRVFKTLGEKISTPDGEPQRWNYAPAIEFDKIVWDETRKMPDVTGAKYWEIFKKQIKSRVQNAGLKFTTWLYDLAVELSAFYDPRQRKLANGKGNAPAASPSSNSRADEYERDVRQPRETSAADRERVRKIFAEKRDNGLLPRNSGEFKRMIDNLGLGIYLSFEEIMSLAAEFFSVDQWRKITIEKLE